MDNRSSRRIVWFVALVAVAVVAAVAFLEVGHYMDRQARVRRTLELRDSIEGSLSAVKDVETGTRGYLITGERSFLAPFEAARRALPARLARVVELSRDDADQEASARRLQKLVEQKVAVAEKQIDGRGADMSEALSTGKVVMDQIRSETDTMVAHLHRDLIQQQADASHAAESSGTALSLGFVFALFIALGGVISSRREMAEAAEMNAALRTQTSQLADAERRWRVLSEASFEGVAVGRDGILLDVNENLARWLGYASEELIGGKSIEIFAVEDRERLLAMTPEALSFYEANLLRKDGTSLPVEVRGRTLTIGSETIRIGVLRDITERKKREAEAAVRSEELRTLSLKDELSGLYNRRGFLELAQHAQRVANRSGRKASIFYIDLNDMKNINDLYGHEAGDNALRMTSSLLTEVFRSSDVIARLGGDEFAVFASECDHDGTIATKGRLRAALERRNGRTTTPYQVSLSVGAVTYDPSQPLGLQALLDRADAAMYNEKRARKAAAAAAVNLPAADRLATGPVATADRVAAASLVAADRTASSRTSQQRLRLVR